LLALLDAPEGINGADLLALLADHGREVRPDQLLTALLRLEGIDHVAVERGAELRFRLTLEGRRRAVELGGGRPVDVRLLMLDLVGFVGYTSAYGDDAAHDAARALSTRARTEVRSAGGDLVKELGDGVLAWLPPTGDVEGVARRIAAGCRRPGGEPWSLRAASHRGTPIRSNGDLFGADVNLVARLCDLAEPGELVSTLGSDSGADAEEVAVRGVDAPVAIRRTVLA